jgi:predicted nucleic acid-binding Zn ribbon protein
VSAVPELRDRLVEDRVRRSWSAIVGADGARRAQPHALTNGCLHVVVDNSPWLQELTLRTGELTARLGERFETVRSLRFTLGRLDARLGPSPVPAAPPPRALTTCFPQTPHIEAVARLRRVA